jgi:N-acetylated-alpha-linked acidic dipeptidase
MQGSDLPEPVGHPRQPPRRLGVRRLGSPCGQHRGHGRGEGDRGPGQDGLEAQADARLRSWDGEEPGLLGSTEWAETHADELRKRPSSTSIPTPTGAGPVHRGQPLVPAPRERGGRRRHRPGDRRERPRPPARADKGRRPTGQRADEKRARRGQLKLKAAEAGGDLPLEALGSGSDYTPFLQHLGISSINLGYGGEDARRDLPLHVRLVRPFHPVRGPQVRLRGRAGADRGAPRAAHGRRRRPADEVRRPRGHGGALRVRGREADRHRARESRKLNGLIDEGAFKLAADPRDLPAAPRPRAMCPGSTSGARWTAAARLKKSARPTTTPLSGLSAPTFNLPRRVSRS